MCFFPPQFLSLHTSLLLLCFFVSFFKPTLRTFNGFAEFRFILKDDFDKVK